MRPVESRCRRGRRAARSRVVAAPVLHPAPKRPTARIVCGQVIAEMPGWDQGRAIWVQGVIERGLSAARFGACAVTPTAPRAEELQVPRPHSSASLAGHPVIAMSKVEANPELPSPGLRS